MNTRLTVNEQDHPMLMKWWEAHGWAGVALSILPKCGVVVEDYSGVPRAAGFLYMDNSTGVSWLEWVVTNPANSAMVSARALKALIGAVRRVAETLDYGVLLTTCRQKSLVRMYEKNGFSKSDEDVTHLIMFTKS